MADVRLLYWALVLSTLAPLGAFAQQRPAETVPPTCEIPADYSVARLPDDGRPTRVDMEFLLIDIERIDQRAELFAVDFALAMRWQDSRLAGRAAGDCAPRQLGSVWHPQLIFINSRDVTPAYEEVVTIDQDGGVLYSQRFQGQFSVALDVRDFPFDSQLLPIEISSLLYGPDKVQFIASGPGIEMLEGVHIAGWDIAGVDRIIPKRLITAGGMTHSTISFAIDIRRRFMYYIWKLFIPLTLITMMAWSVFWLMPTAIGPQIAISIGAVFSLMTFLVSIADTLPEVPYLSRANRFILLCVILVFVALAQSVVTSHYVQTDREKLAFTLDRWGRWIYLTMFAAVLIWSVWL